MVTRKVLAAKFNISVSTLRGWERQFSDWLDAPLGRFGNARKKMFTDDDVRVLATVARLRADDMLFDDIKQVLDAELVRTGDVEVQPEDVVAENSAIVPLAEFMALSNRYEAIESELTVIVEERDMLREDVKRERAVSVESLERAVRAESELSAERRISRFAAITAAVALLFIIVLAVVLAFS